MAEESGFIHRGPIVFLSASSSSERIWSHPDFYPLLIRTPRGRDCTVTLIVLHLVVTSRMQSNFTEQGTPPPSTVKCQESKIPSSVVWRSAAEVSLLEFISAKKNQTVKAIAVCLKSKLDKAKSIEDVSKTNHSSLVVQSCCSLPLVLFLHWYNPPNSNYQCCGF
jgi:hypothetical protein